MMVNRTKSRKPARDLLQLRIELKYCEPTIWRRFAVTENITLGHLHQVIQVVMGWEDCHLHEFAIAGEKYGIPDPDGFGPPVNPESRKTLIKALSGQTTFSYLYDFGDDWHHTIEVECVLPAGTYRHSYCIDGANACPPEDAGGPPGYEFYREAMADPEHPEHNTMVQWRGPTFDPTRFNLEWVNKVLKWDKL